MLSRNLALFFEINLLTRSFMVFLAIFVEICKKSSQTSSQFVVMLLSCVHIVYLSISMDHLTTTQ